MSLNSATYILGYHVQWVCYLLGASGAGFGQTADLVCHHREALSGLTGMRRFDGGIHGQENRPAGNIPNAASKALLLQPWWQSD